MAAFTPDQLKEIATLYRHGRTAFQIGLRFGTSESKVLTAMRREGVKRRKPGARKKA